MLRGAGQPHQNTSAIFVSMKYFETIPDPRVLGRCKYRLCDILFIALATYVCGGEDYTDMHEFAIERAEALKDFVQFEDGVPSVDTFERVLGLIEPNSLNACLMVYAQDIIEDLKDKHIALDGKTIRGSKKHKGSTHILSAWVSEHGLSLSQVAVEEKSNEIKAIPEVLDSLDITGAVITIDAMGTQTDIARQIIEAEGDYVLSLKKNQKALWEDGRDAFSIKTIKTEEYRTDDVDHGRAETRIYTALSTSEALLDEDGKWANLQSLLRVERKVYNKSKQEELSDIQYYISSLPASQVQRIAQCIRGHWSIENQLHWHLDVSFGEDHCRARRGYAPVTLNVLRKLALGIVKAQKDKHSVKKRMFKAAMNPEYLRKLLRI